MIASPQVPRAATPFGRRLLARSNSLPFGTGPTRRRCPGLARRPQGPDLRPLAASLGPLARLDHYPLPHRVLPAALEKQDLAHHAFYFWIQRDTGKSVFGSAGQRRYSVRSRFSVTESLRVTVRPS
jgi:hypothetical protein